MAPPTYTRRQWAIAVPLALALVVGILGLVILGLRLSTPSQPGNRPFVHSVWLRHGGPLDPVRGQMSIDLIRNRLHGGMMRSQIRSLLGPPDVFGDANSYSIGSAPGFPGGYIELVFRRGRLLRASRVACCAPGA